MDSVAGQTFMNYAYSWGAAVVILGTLFKLTHLPFANVMLFIGMGTEVFVFFISAFDRPFDKTADGMDLATDSQLAAALANGAEAVSGVVGGTEGVVGGTNGTVIIGQSVVPSMSGTIVTGGISGDNGSVPTMSFSSEDAPEAGASTTIVGAAGTVIGAPAPAVTPETAQAMEEATTTYVDRLNELNDLLTKIGDLNKRLTIDSEEMETLNRTLTGIARVYEMQLKSASKQITTQDAINEQTAKMAERIAELNSCYARMIEAMTPNIPKN